MAKRQVKGKTRRREDDLREFDVYEQQDGALAVMLSSDEPEDADADLVWSGNALNEADAIVKTRQSAARLRKAPAANVEHEPDVAGGARRRAEEEVNTRLGITTRPAKKKGAKTKRTATSGAKKKTAKAAKTVKKAAKRKTARKSSRR